MRPYEEFKNKVFEFRVQIREFLNKIHTDEKDNFRLWCFH